MDICDSGMLVCPVPTMIGNLVSLKHVYRSWEKESISKISEARPFPFFRDPHSNDVLALAEPAIVKMINYITADVGILNDTPFIAQFCLNGDIWENFELIDQIKIAAIIFQLKHASSTTTTTAGNACMVHQLMNDNKFIVSLSIADSKISFGIKDATKEEPMTVVIRSRITVVDDKFISLELK